MKGIMQHDDMKKCLLESPDLAGVDEATIAELFWRGEAQAFDEGAVIYGEGAKLDETFGLLVAGDLLVEKGGETVGGVAEGRIFGEMAYFTNYQARTATVSVASPQALILRFHVAQEEMDSVRFSALRKALALQTWQKFVNTSQGCAYGASVPVWTA